MDRTLDRNQERQEKRAHFQRLNKPVSRESSRIKNSKGARANKNQNGGRALAGNKIRALQENDQLDASLGFPLLKDIVENEMQEEAGGRNLWNESCTERLGWLLNFRASTMIEKINEVDREVSAIDLYFIQQDGHGFKTRVVYRPYFYVRLDGHGAIAQRAILFLQKKFEGMMESITRVYREDLDLPNHLSGKKALLLKLAFATVNDLIQVRNELSSLILRNRAQQKSKEAYLSSSTCSSSTQRLLDLEDLVISDDEESGHHATLSMQASMDDPIETSFLELREYDVPYAMRAAIDLDLRVGSWYHVKYIHMEPYDPHHISKDAQLVDKAEPIVCAFDIETTKQPLKFPDANAGDQIYMISYMIDRQGFLLVNREFVSESIPAFEYTPKQVYPGEFEVINVENEKNLLEAFISHLKEARPHIYVTYNGDFFDWPFLEVRCQMHHIDMSKALGIFKTRAGMNNKKGKRVESEGYTEEDTIAGDKKFDSSNVTYEYRGHACVHLDAFCWVKRDSYLPQGSQGLKAVTKYKLGYDPVEVDAEDMLSLAQEDPMQMATYSVSDAVATFYLYEKYVHLFVFSLCTIIPLSSEDVLRKGSGTLCEALLMVEAFRGNIICPNKSTNGIKWSEGEEEKFHRDTYLLENETYVGGHVECLESGVFRSDLEYDFKIETQAIDLLIENLDSDLKSALESECGIAGCDVEGQVLDYSTVKSQLKDKLLSLKQKPQRRELPLIYHFDVGAMYPNIILTNRLQPCAIVTERECAACTFNTTCGQTLLQTQTGNKDVMSSSDICQRELEWVWRGDYYPARKQEYLSLKTQVQYENFPISSKDRLNADTVRMVPYTSLSKGTQGRILKERLKAYCSNVYKKNKITREETRQATICMRENPFYVNTVRAFRDRRYEYKSLTKKWKKAYTEAEKEQDALNMKYAQDKSLVYDSLQLAHKCILNSFYGYVMRKGARWHSMEMAGVVTHTGSQIIKQAREWIERIGRPLELDTDGIWCILPSSFPDTVQFQVVSSVQDSLQSPQTREISYPCILLNALVEKSFQNPQYHEQDENGLWKTRSECSIYFEIDGPYKCMVLPASTDEGRLLKKRYAVFHEDGTLAELKGFELKRRGELELVKAFQSRVFDTFLDGNSLEECYASVAACANRWLDILESRGAGMHESEVLELLTEKKTMSGSVSQYGNQKSTSLTTAKRLAELLGDDLLQGRTGLTCEYIIASKPSHEKVTERAIPAAIFAIQDDAVKWHYLRKWCKDSELMSINVCDLLDWEYYWQRFASTVQKIISIPAAFQNIQNPVPRVALPDWTLKKVREQHAKHQQGSMLKYLVTPAQVEAVSHQNPSDCDMTDAADLTATMVQAEVTCSLQQVKVVKFGDVPVDEWLQARKYRWKELLQKRSRLRVMREKNFRNERLMANLSKRNRFKDDSFSEGRNLRRKGLSSFMIENFVFDTQKTLANEAWELIEIFQEENSAGRLICWLITSESRLLQRIELKVPRVFYLECIAKDGEEEERLGILESRLASVAKRVHRTLPHDGGQSQSMEGLVLLELRLSEEHFQKNQKQLIPEIMADPLVVKIHELQVDPLVRAVCKLGCVITSDLNHQSRIDADNASSLSSSLGQFKLDDLRFQSTASVPYLPPSRQKIESISQRGTHLPATNRILLYHTQQNNRAALAIVNPCEMVVEGDVSESRHIRCRGFASIWLADPASGSVKSTKQLSQSLEEMIPDLFVTYQNQNTKQQRAESALLMETCSFDAHIVKDINAAFSAANAFLCKLQNSQMRSAHRPAIVVAQSCFGPDQRRLRSKMTCLHEFPLVLLPWRSSEAPIFRALTWRTEVSRAIVPKLFEMMHFADELIACARYAHIPVGNFVSLTRGIGSTDHSLTVLDILYSRILTAHKHLWWHSSRLELDEMAASWLPSTPSVLVSNTGSYPHVCAELELDGLAVCSILTSSQLASLETDFSFCLSDTSQSRLGMQHPTSEALLKTSEPSSVAFSLLRSLVTTLFKDFVATRNQFADYLLQQVYRWLCASHGALSYDRELVEMVQLLMRKALLQLLAEFRRLGAEVIYADVGNSKIVVNTKRNSMKEAQSYLNFVLTTIAKQEMFQVLQLTPRRFLSHLFFYDIENYGAVAWNTDSNESKSPKPMEDALHVISHWNIANYLPAGVDEYFVLLVGQFIRRYAKFHIQPKSDENNQMKESIDEYFDQDMHMKQQLPKYLQNLMRSYFANKMLRIVTEINQCDLDPSSFPMYAGSHLPLQNPALELLKSVTAIFALEPAVALEVENVKRTLLRVLNVSEFAEAARFRNPSLSFIIPQVICSTCNLCRSIDVCRDPQLFQVNVLGEDVNDSTRDEKTEREENTMVQIQSAWHCPRCLTSYDLELMELILVEMVQFTSLNYQLQDLYCYKCQLPKEHKMSQYSVQHQFYYLQEVCETLQL
ncbi:hypothetical protein ABG067_003860 [Albugo candida]